MACAVAAASGGARVTVLEATSVIGGTTAISGGAIWVPASDAARTAGVADSTAEAGAYLRELALGDFDEGLAEAYLRLAPATVAALERATAMRWEVQPGWPDYHAELPGAKLEGRSLEIRAVAVDHDALAMTRRDPYGVPPMSVNEERSANPPNAAELRRRERAGIVARGRGLIAALHEALRELGGEVRCDVRAQSLIGSRDGVRGVVAGGERIEGTVALTTGGFERSAALVRTFLRGPMSAPGGAPLNRGDGLQLGLAAGAAVANMSEAWWCPALRVPDEAIDAAPFYRMLFLDLAKAGGILVDARGRRFCNEAANYNDVGRGMQGFDPSTYRFAAAPSWLVFDAGRRAAPLGPLEPESADPAWLSSAPTVAALAARIGVPEEALEETVVRFNSHAEAGEDRDFGRGSYAFDRFSAGGPGLRAVRDPPFYAVAVLPGCLGTKGGLRIDEHGRVLNDDGDPIAGLHAAGNAAASPFGCAYPGGGSTIGPALTFGWAAGAAAAAL
jgi:succinate dehydrogenase/fumarate reductase flavoprotein subunit